MKILHISTSDGGGAGNACIRLHQGMLESGIDSKVLVFQKKRNIPEVYQLFEHKKSNYILDKYRYFKFGFYEGLNRIKLIGRDKQFDIFTRPKSLLHPELNQLFEWANIINLHWVAYFIDYPSFFRDLKKPLAWTLHDMNPFTGGCHYSRDCSKYKTDCDLCPQLEGGFDSHYAKQNFIIKQKSLENQPDLHIITPSEWLMEKSKESALFSKYFHHHIPNGIDDRTFIHRDKQETRKKLGFPVDKKILLFVSDWVEREGKGFTFLHEAQNLLSPDERPLLCVAGRTNLELAGKHFIKLGFVKDEKTMSRVYSACDAYVLPSLEDNLPNTIIESLLCGTPVIAFPVGGIPEMIEQGKNGILCPNTSTDSLKTAMNEFLSGKYEFNSQEIRKHAIAQYSLLNQAKKYIELYKSI